MAPVPMIVPKLLPITGTWVAPFTLYYLLLSGRIFNLRVQHERYIGDKITTSTPGEKKRDDLEVATRCQANFLENVPLAFIFLIVAELNGGNRKYLNYIMGTLLALRVAHADFGLRLEGKFGDNGIGRPVGYVGTSGVLLALSSYAAYLAKGYWGF